MKRIIALMLVLLMVGVVLSACGGTKSDLESVKAKGKLIVGITDFEPMDYKDESGEWIGFDAELSKAFAESLGVEVEFSEIDWDGKVLELDSGKVDCIWNGMTLTDEVKASMSCTDAYCENAQVVVVNKDVAEEYATADSCKELKFAVEEGSAGQTEALNLVGEDNKDNVKGVDSQAKALTEVASGTCDAAVIDLLMAKAMVGEGTGYDQLIYTVSLNSEEYGIGFRKDSDITAKCNEFLANAKADGTIDKLTEKYLIKK